MTKYKSFPATKRNPPNSIPIKYQCIIETLGDIDNIENIHIVFDYNLGKTIGVSQPGWNNRRLKGDTNDLSSFIEIMQIIYSPYMESSSLNETIELSAWTICVRSCIRTYVTKISMLLRDEILPIIKEWLNQQRTDVWYVNRQNLQIGINKEISKYCILETQEENIIKKVIKDV